MAMEKTFDAAEAERRIYAEWEAGDCFKAGAGAAPGAETYCIVIPPPNVTGSLHMGHAFNNTIQDILTRWKRMQGFDALWQPGLDHAGIAAQMVVERQLAAEGNIGRRDMGREAFVKRVWDWKAESGGMIIGQLKRLGCSCDWSRERFTMDDGLSRAVAKTFVELFNQGLIYRDVRLVNWDPHFETAISDLEVEQKEVQGKLWRFRYPLADGATYEHPTAFDDDGAPISFETRDYVVVATTRPETMLGDSGVAVHPDDARYAGIVGKDVILPLVGRRIPVVADEYPDPKQGSGAVKMTPAHDFNDFQVGKRQALRLINVMTGRAAMFLKDNRDFLQDCEPEAETLELDGLDRFEARKRVVAMMEARGLLDGIDENPHTVPYGDRSGVPIEPYLTDQWFVNAEALAKDAIAAVRDGRTKILPEHNAKTYFYWLENIEPWCVSRQLWWGHQVPVWHGPRIPLQQADDDADGLEAARARGFCAMSEAEAIDQARTYAEAFGLAGKVDIKVVDFADLPKVAPGEAGADGRYTYPIARDPDVLDTWFSSALWPFSTLGWPDETEELKKYYQTDVLLTGFDILFFWVARMMMMGLHFMEEAPFHTVYIHALVRDEKGQKMSKSKGNVIDPLVLVDEYGADAVRFTLTSMAALGRDLKLSTSRVEGYRNFGTKLWNAARFCEMNDCRRDPGFDPRAARQTVNKWIIGETARVRETADAALEAYRFNDYAAALYTHVWNVFCDWYVEFAKPLLTGEDEAAKAETRATAAWALDEIVTLLHPVMPFITEALWQGTSGEGTLMLRPWPTYAAADLADSEADAEMAWTIHLIEQIRSVRAEMNVAPGARIDMVLTDASPQAEARLTRNEALIKRLARLNETSTAAAAPEGSVTIALEDGAVNLPLKGVVDVAAEQARLDKAKAKLVKEIGGLEKKLANEKFLAKAPEEVVAEQRDRLAAAQAEAAQLDAAAARLATLA